MQTLVFGLYVTIAACAYCSIMALVEAAHSRAAQRSHEKIKGVK